MGYTDIYSQPSKYFRMVAAIQVATNLKEYACMPEGSHLLAFSTALLQKESAGKNRAPVADCQIKATDDVEAVECWLQEYKHVAATYKAYHREAQRLLLWCGYTMKKPLSGLTRDDFVAYREFLHNPLPRHVWCGPRTQDKTQWKPFVGPLSASACQTAMTIIHSMMEYLMQAGYLLRNPLALLRQKVSPHAEQHRKLNALSKRLEPEEIQALLATIEALPETTSREQFDKHRTRFLFYLLLLTGLRVNELVIHTWNAFRLVQGRWWLFIIGKGNKPRFVPITDELLQEIKRYRHFLGKPPYPLSDDETPILGHQTKPLALTARRINGIITQLAQQAAQPFQTHPDKYQRLLHLSAHSLRHLFASLQDQAEIPLTQIRDNLGHSDIKVTSIYLHSSDIKRHKELQRVKINVTVEI